MSSYYKFIRNFSGKRDLANRIPFLCCLQSDQFKILIEFSSFKVRSLNKISVIIDKATIF